MRDGDHHIHAPLGITMGDPAGIGPEIIVKMLCGTNFFQIPIVVIGDAKLLRRAARILGVDVNIRIINDPSEAMCTDHPEGSIAVIQPTPELPDSVPFGCVDARSGAAAYGFVACAVALAMSGRLSAIVTAPINKEALSAAGIPYPGHTEILGHLSGAIDFGMMLANDDLRVMLVSIHISLKNAVEAVTDESEDRAIRLAHRACKQFGIANPRIAVAGLNPHAGENGLFGSEDGSIIAPAIERARRAGVDASGPWSPDIVFMRARRGDFDVVVAQYHDQGLIPIKYLGIEHGVNITVGLPFIRTSVDHGTAFDIAGTGKADQTSLVYAVKQALRITTSCPAHMMAQRGSV